MSQSEQTQCWRKDKNIPSRVGCTLPKSLLPRTPLDRGEDDADGAQSVDRRLLFSESGRSWYCQWRPIKMEDHGSQNLLNRKTSPFTPRATSRQGAIKRMYFSGWRIASTARIQNTAWATYARHRHRLQIRPRATKPPFMPLDAKDRPKPVYTFSAENETENESHHFRWLFSYITSTSTVQYNFMQYFYCDE